MIILQWEEWGCDRIADCNFYYIYIIQKLDDNTYFLLTSTIGCPLLPTKVPVTFTVRLFKYQGLSFRILIPILMILTTEEPLPASP